MNTVATWGWLALGLFALAAFAPAAPLTTLSGHLDHAPATDSVRLVYGRHRATAVLSPTGNFRLALPDLAQPMQATFSYGDQHTYLWLSPGDRQHLMLDFPKFDETLRYSGRGSVASNYLARALYRFSFQAPGQVSRPGNQVTEATRPAEYRQAEDAYRQQRRAFLAAYAQAHPLPAALVREQRQLIDVQWAIDLLFYPMLWNPAHRSQRLTARYFDFMQQVALRSVAAHPTETTKEDLVILANVYDNRLVPSGHLSTDPAEARRLYALATAELGPTPTRDQALYNLFEYHLMRDLPGVMAAYPTFRAQNRDTILAQQLRQRLAGRQQLEPGQLAPAFTLRDNTGQEVSLRDLRGKVVYLDFWGTWCPPCMEEMTKYSPALKQQFTGREVVFVYVALRDTEARWQQVLAEKQLTSANSVHLRAPDKDLEKRYQLLRYPSYFLIGRDGRVVQAYTSRPSDGPKTVAAIEAALNGPTGSSAQR